MMSHYLLDTNTVSYIIQGNFPAVHRRLVEVPMAQVFISSVTEGELRYGLARRPEATTLRRIVHEFLLRVTALPWGSEAAQQYGTLRAGMERIGLPMGNLDLMIGSHALAAGAILVTNDQVFSRIKNLKIEDWTV